MAVLLDNMRYYVCRSIGKYIKNQYKDQNKNHFPTSNLWGFINYKEITKWQKNFILQHQFITQVISLH